MFRGVENIGWGWLEGKRQGAIASPDSEMD
jgi:hypothetical protein